MTEDNDLNIAVVGPTGVLGRALIPILLQNGHTVRALARSVAKARTLLPAGVSIVECDLLAADIDEHLPSMLEGCDAVVHIATAIPRDFTAPNAWEKNTRLRTDGVRSLLQASLIAGARRYVQQSITMAYPDRGDQWITEDTPLDTSPARASICGPVMTMEQLVRDIAPGRLAWCILRGGTFVGEGTFQEDTMQRLRAGQVSVACDGRNFTSLIHVADMATAVAVAIEHAPAGSTFNIVAEPLRQGDYLDRLADALGVSRPLRDAAVACPPSWRCSNQAARATLKWLPQHDIIPRVASKPS